MAASVAAATPSSSASERVRSMEALLGARMEALELRPETRAEAAKAAASAAVPGLDEQRLWSEWLSDCLVIQDEDEFMEVTYSPDRSYLEWIEDRVAEPFRVNHRALVRTAETLGYETTNLLFLIRWPQEIAWAMRHRASEETPAALVVLANMFLRRAAQDPAREFDLLVKAYVDDASNDPAYVGAAAHSLSADQIVAGEGDHRFRSLYVRVAEVVYAKAIESMPEDVIEKTAAVLRKASSRTAAVALKAIDSIGDFPLSRMTNVISAAIELGLGADDLVKAEARFVAELRRGAVVVETAGLPYSEFLAWLRSERHDPAGPASKSEVARRMAKVKEVSDQPGRFLARLPPDYVDLGGSEAETYHAWIYAFLLGDRPPPADLLTDYGFVLVGRGFRRASVRQGRRAKSVRE